MTLPESRPQIVFPHEFHGFSQIYFNFTNQVSPKAVIPEESYVTGRHDQNEETPPDNKEDGCSGPCRFYQGGGKLPASVRILQTEPARS